MGAKNKIHYTVAKSEVSRNLNLKFSFEFYDGSHEFCLSNWSKGQIAEALSRLKEICCMSFQEIRSAGRVFHFHSVLWEETTQKNGFPNKKANTLEAFQFALLGVNGQKARVFGAYADNTFYIVWFDLEHEIWPSFKKHT